MMRNASSTYAKDKSDYGYESKFPQRLRALMESTGTTQDRLAECCGVTRQCVALWKNGGTKPDLRGLEKIADFFSCSVDYLLCRTESKSGNADVMAVEKRLGLQPNAQAALERIVERSKPNFYMPYAELDKIDREEFDKLDSYAKRWRELLAFINGSVLVSSYDMASAEAGDADCIVFANRRFQNALREEYELREMSEHEVIETFRDKLKRDVEELDEEGWEWWYEEERDQEKRDQEKRYGEELASDETYIYNQATSDWQDDCYIASNERREREWQLRGVAADFVFNALKLAGLSEYFVDTEQAKIGRREAKNHKAAQTPPCAG
ncbi:MAG: helix-turn-helix transcriptional regulator [Oscillospiraceae bacterium]|jgi:transcriptional regulator with XRE-family HTH domain|nr:helix-turn-helix transcriptional regulator [Oscillospiraceae bacterium]